MGRVGVFQRTTGVLDGSWVPVLSSWIDAARYDAAAQVLHIRTKEGREYPWVQSCPPEKARGFFRVQSQGKWIWRYAPPRGFKPRARARRTRTKTRTRTRTGRKKP